MITISPNVAAKTVSSPAPPGPRVVKQKQFPQYKRGRPWWGSREAKIPFECFCGMQFRTVQARDRHMRDCHSDGDAA